MKQLLKAAFFSILIYGCQGNVEKQQEPVVIDEPQTVEAVEKEYSIEIEANKSDKYYLEVSINTNFPDGTSMLFSVERIHFLKGSNDEYAGEIYQKDIVIENGKFEEKIKIDDTEWYNEHQRLVKTLPGDIMPIRKISDNIEISVLFTPARKQPKNVLDIIGDNGQYIKGNGAKKMGRITTFSVEKEVHFPFKN